jgi:hypothetical protein
LKHRWEIEATVARAGFTPPDTTAIGRVRVTAQDSTWDEVTVSRTDVLALLDAYAQSRRMHDFLLDAALDNADRASSLLDRTGKMTVEIDRLRALAFPADAEPAVA